MDKPLGLRCPHLREDNLCDVYEERPAICRDYRADELCTLIEAPTLEERVEKYLGLFGLQSEARASREQGCASMRMARRVASLPRPGGAKD
nr:MULTISPECIES: YkgJ family cysteine cluster protein [unclassified Myxococcus]